jgi:hypothetical protein
VRDFAFDELEPVKDPFGEGRLGKAVEDVAAVAALEDKAVSAEDSQVL